MDTIKVYCRGDAILLKINWVTAAELAIQYGVSTRQARRVMEHYATRQHMANVIVKLPYWKGSKRFVVALRALMPSELQPRGNPLFSDSNFQRAMAERRWG